MGIILIGPHWGVLLFRAHLQGSGFTFIYAAESGHGCARGLTRLSVVFPTATSPSSLNTSSRGGFVHVCKASSRRVVKWCVRAAGLEKTSLCFQRFWELWLSIHRDLSLCLFYVCDSSRPPWLLLFGCRLHVFPYDLYPRGSIVLEMHQRKDPMRRWEGEGKGAGGLSPLPHTRRGGSVCVRVEGSAFHQTCACCLGR